MVAVIYIPVLLGISGLSISTYFSELPRMLELVSHWLQASRSREASEYPIRTITGPGNDAMKTLDRQRQAL